MKKTTSVFAFLLVAIAGMAQLAGNYTVTGHFFHPTAPRSLNLAKTLTLVGANTYEAFMGDVGGSGLSFRFTVDVNNNLVNWVATGSTPPVPQSGFMTLDNPGNTVFPPPVQPGLAPFLHSTYNNKYDPATKTFFMHYGYATGSSNQNGYTRQIYEKWVLMSPPSIISATPMTGTAFTQITITGNNLSTLAPGYGVRFGSFNADSFAVVSTNEVRAWLGGGINGKMVVSNSDGVDSLDGFSYIPLPPVSDSTFRYLGAPGFSSNAASSVNAALGAANVPYVVFVDSATSKAQVMKLTGTTWESVGLNVSDGSCSSTKIAIGRDFFPVVAYSDLANSGRLKVKKFNGTEWIDLGLPFAKAAFSFAMDIDTSNKIYLVGIDSLSRINMYRFNGSSWETTLNIGTIAQEVAIAIDALNNLPYVMYTNTNFPGQATVMNYNGSAWVNVGTPNFTNASVGVYYPNIKIDRLGNPIVAFQDDDGFERASSYRFSGGVWNPIGNRFSKGRSHFVALAIDNNNIPAVSFIETSMNKMGSIRTYSDSSTWDILGQRGSIPTNSIEKNAFLFDTTNTPLIAFRDLAHGNKVSVMKKRVVSLWVGGSDTSWENPGNWNGGVLPTSSSDVVIPAGVAVTVNSNLAVNSVSITPGSILTLTAGHVLVIIGQ